MSRKFVSISTAMYSRKILDGYGESHYEDSTRTVAVADDGTAWEYDEYTQRNWRQLPAIPQD